MMYRRPRYKVPKIQPLVNSRSTPTNGHRTTMTPKWKCDATYPVEPVGPTIIISCSTSSLHFSWCGVLHFKRAYLKHHADHALVILSLRSKLQFKSEILSRFDFWPLLVMAVKTEVRNIAPHPTFLLKSFRRRKENIYRNGNLSQVSAEEYHSNNHRPSS